MAPFAPTCEELRVKGISLEQAPDEYIVNYGHGKPATEYRSPDMYDAIELGLMLSATRVIALTPLGLTVSAGASRRGKIYRHNRKVAAKRSKTT